MNRTPQKAEFITMGCRLNLSESNALARQLSDVDDLVVVNSCAVTHEAVRQTKQAIRKARRKNPFANIIVTGCAAQVEPDSFARMPEVTRVVGNALKQRTEAFRPSQNDPLLVPDIMELKQTAPHLVAAFSGKARAFVEIQNGCDHRCTFCIIPFGRGNSRSVPAGLVVEQISRLVDEGYNEIVLTGVDVTSYGHDLPGKQNLGSLVERVLKHVPSLPRLRLSSIDGVEIDDLLLEMLTSEKRVMPHVHLSLQSGDNLILKRMKRRHSREQSINLVERLKAKRPEIAIGADIIAGFPTENEAMFENSCALIRDCDIVHGHIFPYSIRNGTPAARMPQLDRNIIKQRAQKLREIVAQQHAKWQASLLGSSQRVVVENCGTAGYAENFAHISLNEKAEAGQIVLVKISGIESGKLQGAIAA